MEKEILKEISKKLNMKEKRIIIMFEIIKDMGYNIKDFSKIIEEFYG